MNTIAVVTGATSGIGLATARALRDRGCVVYGAARHPGQEEGIRWRVCDVTDQEAFAALLQEVRAECGRLDLLINNAGFGISGAAEFTDNRDAKRLLEVNLFGVVNGCRAAIPLMREQGSGRIVNISSVAAPVAIPFQSWYSVSKAGVSAYTAAAAEEVRPFGISLCAILPGDIRTGFTAAREKSPLGDDVYGGRIARMAPAAAGAYIAHIAQKKRVKPEYAIGFKYKFFCLLVKLMPCALRSFIVGKLYAGL